MDDLNGREWLLHSTTTIMIVEEGNINDLTIELANFFICHFYDPILGVIKLSQRWTLYTQSSFARAWMEGTREANWKWENEASKK